MEAPSVRGELVVLIANYLREKNPDVYRMLCEHCGQKILPPGMKTMEEALDVRYGHMPANQFLEFLKTLAPNDDYPSLYRRMSSFESETPVCGHLSLISTNESHQGPVYSLCLDPLSRFCISGSDDHTMKLFILPDFREAFTFVGHENVISNVCLHPDVSYVLSSSHDTTVRIWSLNTGECVAVLKGFTDNQVHYALFSPDGRLIACACEDGYLYLWHTRDALQEREPFAKFTTSGNSPVIWACFSPGSEFVAFSAEPNLAIVVSISTRRQYSLNLHSGLINLISFSKRLYPSPLGPAPKVLTVGGEEGTLAIWSLGRLGYDPSYVFKSQSVGRKGAKIAMTVWDLDDHLLVILRKKNIVVVDSVTGQTVVQIPELIETTSGTLIAQNPKDREYFVVITSEGIFSVWNIPEARMVAKWASPQPAEFVDCSWSSDGTTILASDDANRIYVLGFSLKNKNPGLVLRRPDEATIKMRFEVKCDMTFQAACAEDESALARRMQTIPERDGERPDRTPHQINPQSMPDYFETVFVRTPNPLRVTPDDDYEQLLKEEQESAGQTITDLSILPELERERPVVHHRVPRPRSVLDPPVRLVLPSCPSNYGVYQGFANIQTKPWLKALWTGVYVPQIGDDVVYIHAANNRGILEGSQLTFPPVFRTTLSAIQPIDDGFVLSLSVCQTTAILRVFYLFSEFCEYIMSYSVYQQSTMAVVSLRPESLIKYRANGMKMSGIFMGCVPGRNGDLHMSISVRGEGTGVVKISPWQLLEVPTGPIQTCFGNVAFCQTITQQIQGLIPTNSPFYQFGNLLVPNTVCPVDLRFIMERLRYGWYRGILALANDLRLCYLLAKNHPLQEIQQAADMFIPPIKAQLDKYYPMLANIPLL